LKIAAVQASRAIAGGGFAKGISVEAAFPQ